MATLTPAQTKSISQQISAIQSGMSKISQARSSGGSNINSVQEADSYLSSGNKGAAVNAQGQLVQNGKVVGNANPADLPAPGAVQAEPTDTEIPKTAPNAAVVAPPNQVSQQSVVPYEQASKNLASGGLQGQELAGAQSSLKDWYTRAHGLSQQTGVPAAQDAGGGMVGAQQYLGATGAQETPNLLGGIMETDSNFDSILTSLDEFMNPVNQRTSLLDEYKKLSSSLGIEGMNAELIDAKRIIEGTEDDIRSEVTATGGFATDSQVLALANARNKSLIKNYNYLLESRDNATQQLSTMMDLTIADRDAAQKEFDTKMNFAFKVAEFKERAANNARDTYMSLGDRMGWDTLLSSTSPYEQNLIQKTLGVSKDALGKMALQSQQDRSLSVRKAEADIANTYSQINERNGTLGSGVDEKTMGKIQSSPEYKTINGVLPAIQALKDYKDAINNYGTTEQFSGEGKGTLKGTYGNALATWKTLAGLGALSGADFTLAENAIPETGFFKRSSTSKAKLDTSINNAIKQAENLTKRLQQNYPQASALLEQQLDDAKISAFPERFTMSPDGELIEITN